MPRSDFALVRASDTGTQRASPGRMQTTKHVVRRARVIGSPRKSEALPPREMPRGTRPGIDTVVVDPHHETAHNVNRALGRAPVSTLPPPMLSGAVVEHQLGIMWMVDLKVELFARNLAVAGALEHSRQVGFRMGEAAAAIAPIKSAPHT